MLMGEHGMRVGYHIADLYLATAAMKRRVEDPRVRGERVWDSGDHGDSGCRAYTADVGDDDVADDEDFDYEAGIT